MIETLFLFILVMGGLFAGIFTPTEAGGVGAGGAILLAFLRRRLTFKGLMKAISESTRISCMVLIIVAGATIFGHFLAITRLPYTLANWVAHLPLPHGLVMGIIILIYLIKKFFKTIFSKYFSPIFIFFP